MNHLEAFINSQPRGYAAQLAQRMDISKSMLSQLKSGKSPISPWRALALERGTDGAFTRNLGRPDDWREHWPEFIPPKKSSFARKKHDRKRTTT